MDHNALAARVRTDPAGVGYAAPLAAGDLTSIAALGNDRAKSKGATVQTPVPPAALLRYAGMSGIRSVAEANVADTTPVGTGGATVGSLCLTIRDMLVTGTVPFDTADEENAGLLAGLVAVGKFTQAQADGLMALGKVAASDFEAAGLVPYGGAVSVRDLEIAINGATP